MRHFLPGWFGEHLVQERADALYDEAHMIAASYSNMYQGERQDAAEVSTQIRILAQYLRAEIWIVNRQGTIIMDSLGGSRVQTRWRNSIPPLSGTVPIPSGIITDFLRGTCSAYLLPLPAITTPTATCSSTIPMSQISSSQDSILTILYLTAAMLFGLSLIILFVFTQTVYLPLRKINEGANEYAAGNLDYRIDVPTHDEMGYLAATLNYMSDELGKMEEYQKNFIANVSHDFRSPLTSIKGYLEAILDGTIPPEMYEKYLSRVISETERLHKLTESMLTLNSLDAKGYLSRTNFDINRVIKDTAASFEGTCGAKNIRFELTFSDTIQMVFADMEKIQQVMYNLIDNAIKFSHPDSTIYIQASAGMKKYLSL